MQDRGKQMKIEIRVIAKYRSLIITRYYIMAVLMIALFLQAFTKGSLNVAYVIVFYGILPFILKEVLKQKLGNHSKETSILPMLGKKYEYSKVSYLAHSIAFFIAVMLLVGWNLSFRIATLDSNLMLYYSLFVLVTVVLLRFVGIIFYELRINYLLRNNKL